MTARGGSQRGENARADKQARRRRIGWGLTSEGAQEGTGSREAIFAICVAVVVCVGGWVFITSALSGRDQSPILSAERPRSGASFTVVLREVERQDRGSWEPVVQSAPLRALAGQSSFHFADSRSGSFALCVGLAEREDSPELRRLLDEFRGFRTSGGSRPFEAAAIRRSP